MNLTAMLSQMWSPAFFTFCFACRTCKKLATAFDSIAVKFISLQHISFRSISFYCDILRKTVLIRNTGLYLQLYNTDRQSVNLYRLKSVRFKPVMIFDQKYCSLNNHDQIGFDLHMYIEIASQKDSNIVTRLCGKCSKKGGRQCHQQLITQFQRLFSNHQTTTEMEDVSIKY